MISFLGFEIYRRGELDMIRESMLSQSREQTRQYVNFNAMLKQIQIENMRLMREIENREQTK
jgi:GTP cyclohydrolase II